tara:strand:+ start:402 stop:1586 length:1185 start_codon:yes stop_codon:yes gene_type:complete
MNKIESIKHKPIRGFNKSEFEERLIKAQKIMLEEKLDGIFLTTPANIRYFSGFDTQFWESPTRPWFLVVPQKGNPIAVIPEIGLPEMSLTWLDEILTWPSPVPSDDGISILQKTIDSLPKRFGRFGSELGYEMSLRMPVIDFLKLKNNISTELVDASKAIWDIRMIKTKSEISHISYICSIVSDAYEEVQNNISIGESEREVARKLRIDIARRGSDSTPFLPVISGQGGVSQIVCGPHDRILQKGDVLFIDTGSTYDGYFCDFDRNYAIGEISSKAAKVNDLLWLATEEGIKASLIGSTTEDVWVAINKIIEEAKPIGNNVGRLGHGLGLQLTEPPSHRLGEKTVLKENMVLTIEPGIEYEAGKMIVHEENIVITKEGPVLLTKRASREMPVIK